MEAFAAPCDVGDADELGAFLDRAHEALGGVDVLVNNTSGFGVSDDEAGWKTGFDIDVMGSVRASWHVVPWMEARGGGSIIHISSTSGMEAGSPPALCGGEWPP
ncbi:MAG: SDR family NAD(P)-dependent oxidoreductase [Gammaproteobacteria bacterium]|nr:SDR family NAD(P)-dependent oxidoreductase [Gammaproteobacteria bacterium]